MLVDGTAAVNLIHVVRERQIVTLMQTASLDLYVVKTTARSLETTFTSLMIAVKSPKQVNALVGSEGGGVRR